MELPQDVQFALKLASIRVKLLFDTYQWKWNGIGVPSVKAIEEHYTNLANDVWAQSMEIDPETKETANCGNAMSGRLVVEFVDDQWIFSIQVADTFTDGATQDVEEASPRVKGLANVRQMGFAN